MGALSDFGRDQIVGVHLDGASVKNCHIIGCIQSDSFQGYVGIYELWKDNIIKEELCLKINIDRKRSSYTEKDYFEKSQNYCSTGDRTVELNIHLEDPVSIKNDRCELHKFNIHGRAANVKPLITESNSQMPR
jgi:hypothetical protein